MSTLVKRDSVYRAALCLAIAVLIAGGIQERAFSGIWHTERVPGLRATFSAKLSPVGRVHLVGMDVSDRLAHAVFVGGVWRVETIDAGAVRYATKDASLTCDGTGSIHIAYINGNALCYATNIGGTWSHVVVSTVSGVETTDIAVDVSGMPAILYRQGLYGSTTTIIRRDAGGMWSVVRVDWRYCADVLVAGSSGTLQYVCADSVTVRWNTIQGTSCVSEPIARIDQSGEVSGYQRFEADVVTDGNGSVHLAFSHFHELPTKSVASGRVGYCRLCDGTWSYELVDGSGTNRPGIVLDGHGVPYVLFTTNDTFGYGDDPDLLMKRRIGSSWQQEVYRVRAYGYGEAPAFCTDVDGIPHIFRSLGDVAVREYLSALAPNDLPDRKVFVRGGERGWIHPDRGERCTVSWDFPTVKVARVDVFDLTGRMIARIPGSDDRSWLEWDCKNGVGDTVASGVYVVRVVSPSFAITKKVCVAR